MNLRMLAALTCWMCSNPALAEVYKYQDEHGQWHFGDRVPREHRENANKIEFDSKRKDGHTDMQAADSAFSDNSKDLFGVKEISEQSGDQVGTDPAITSSIVNLAEQLAQRFKPDTAVSTASISTVAIESYLGSGSGFFVSNTGHIITNRHVIRPHQKAVSMLESLEQREKKIAPLKKKLDFQHTQLQKAKLELDQLKYRMESASGDQADLLIAEYEYRKSEYDIYMEQYTQDRAAFKEHKREVTKKKNDLNWNLSMATISQRFKVYLKDQRVFTGRLIEISDDHDLALLKIDDVWSPKLNIGDLSGLEQGHNVYAIGSPLGQRDSVTSGVIAQLRQGQIITDAKVLPGNSGGPLIDSTGRVIGVNTARFSQTENSEGFGIAIAIDIALSEFSRHFSE